MVVEIGFHPMPEQIKPAVYVLKGFFNKDIIGLTYLT